jgi:hypothetical protein
MSGFCPRVCTKTLVEMSHLTVEIIPCLTEQTCHFERGLVPEFRRMCQHFMYFRNVLFVRLVQNGQNGNLMLSQTQLPLTCAIVTAPTVP